MNKASSIKENTFWKNSYFIALFIIFTIGFILRFYALDERPLHHDESLHGVYSLYYLFDSKSNFYKYNPLLHGPFLYHILPWFFWIIDISKWTLRLPAALIGSLLTLSPLLFKSHLKKTTILCAASFIALGPTFIYWSRFMRHDSFVLLSLLIFFFALTSKINHYSKSLLIALALGINFCTKENFFIHILFIIVLVLYEFILVKFIYKHNSTVLLERLKSFIKENPISIFIGFLLFCLIGSFYYSSGYVYSKGILDGLYRKSLTYWFNQHNIERIPGPFSYTFLINSFYESWWLPFTFIHIFFFYKERSKKYLSGFLITLLPGTVFTYSSLQLNQYPLLFNFMNLKIHQDLFLFFPLLYHSILGTSLYLYEEKKNHAYGLFIFTATLFTYSFIGEKVPWLSLYPLFAGLYFFSLDFNRYKNSTLILVTLVFIPKLIFNTTWLNFKYSHNALNLLSQVHTTKEFEETLTNIRQEIDSFENGHGPLFLAKDGHTWPTSWYLFNRKEYKYHYTKKQLPNFKYILTSPQDKAISKEIDDSYRYKDLTYRSWYLPDYEKLSVTDFLHYWWNFEAKGNLGTAKLRLYYHP